MSNEERSKADSVSAAEQEVSTDEYFGGCPHCGKTDGYFNFGRAHYFVCHEHRVKWFVGANLFSSWRQESRSDWDQNAEKFGIYADVEPVQAPKDRWQVLPDDPLPEIIVNRIPSEHE